MKNLIVTLIVLLPALASAQDCYLPKLMRDAVRAVALVSDRSMITDIVGDASGDLWANYRYHGYSDHYQVKADAKSCRILSLVLVEANGPIKEPSEVAIGDGSGSQPHD